MTQQEMYISYLSKTIDRSREVLIEKGVIKGENGEQKIYFDKRNKNKK